MTFLKRLLITLLAMLLVSYGIGQLWLAAFDFAMPSYLAGTVGGLTALPVWEMLRPLRKKKQ
jgi:hypothetical protein